MTQIRDYAIERLASTVYDNDLIDIQIMEAGSDQYEEARMKVSELRKLMNDGSTPLRYKALITQNAPVATTTDPTMGAGQIWTLESYNAADAATIAALELVSGTLYAVGSKYRSATDQTLSVDAGTTLSYDGSPYIVSTDANGNFAPFVNTLGGNPTFSYVFASNYNIILNGAFIKEKTFLKIFKRATDDDVIIYVKDINTVRISNSTSAIPIDDLLNYTPIEIEVYP